MSVRNTMVWRRRAATLAEAVMCVALVGGLLVASLNTVGAMRAAEVDGRARARGQLLARELMAEILTKEYADEAVADIDIGNLALTEYTRGPDTGESSRAAFDDVDDYDGWARQPPENRDGTAIAGTSGFQRSVSVGWVDAATRGARVSESGLKRIVVSVTYDGDPVAQVQGYKGLGLPAAVAPLRVLLVVPDAELIGTLDQHRIDVLEAWGYTVTAIDDSETGVTMDTAVAESDVVWVGAEASETELGTKLSDAAVGLVNGNAALMDELGIASSMREADGTDIVVTDATHAITTGYTESANLTIFTSTQVMHTMFGFGPTNAQYLAHTEAKNKSMYPSLMVLESGELLYGGATAQGRRVQLPWGRAGVRMDLLNADGQAVLQRSLEWAAGNLQ